MHECIHPNRWINSERRDESAGGETMGHHLSTFASCSGLHFAEKLDEVCRRGALGTPLQGLVSSLVLWEHVVTVWWGRGGFVRMTWSQTAMFSRLWIRWTGSLIHSWVIKTIFLFLISLSSTFLMASTTTTSLFSWSLGERITIMLLLEGDHYILIVIIIVAIIIIEYSHFVFTIIWV